MWPKAFELSFSILCVIYNTLQKVCLNISLSGSLMLIYNQLQRAEKPR